MNWNLSLVIFATLNEILLAGYIGLVLTLISLRSWLYSFSFLSFFLSSKGVVKIDPVQNILDIEHTTTQDI